jgi:hypothetical protein
MQSKALCFKEVVGANVYYVLPRLGKMRDVMRDVLVLDGIRVKSGLRSVWRCCF